MAKQLPVEQFRGPNHAAELRASFERAKREGRVRVIRDGKVIRDGTGTSISPPAKRRQETAPRPARRGFVQD